MWLSNYFPTWFSSWLRYLGFVGKKGRLVFLGLDCAGKTTLMGFLANGEIKWHSPTLMPTGEQFWVGDVQFSAYDLGGHRQARRVWKEYCMKTDGIVFLVDAADKERLQEAGQELKNLLDDPECEDLPVAIMFNKTDRLDALTETDLITGLDIHKLLVDNCRRKVFMVSILRKRGIYEAIKWLSTFLK